MTNFLIVAPRSKAEIPLKLREFAVILSDSQYQFKLIAKHYTELKISAETDSGDVTADDFQDFMMEPTKSYKILFHAEQYEFTENSELSVSRDRACIFDLVIDYILFSIVTVIFRRLCNFFVLT